MAQTMLEQLESVDRAVLTDIVRQDQRSPDYKILDWTVRPMKHKGQTNPDGLYLFEGRGRDESGENSWCVVSKNIQNDPDPKPLDHLWYWKRELEFYRSGLLEQIPGKMATPGCYRVEETPWGVQFWLEYVEDQAPERWTLDHFAYAAHQLGCWNAICYQNQFLPGYPWLCREPQRDWLVWSEISTTWRDRSSPYLRKVLCEADQARAVRLLDEREEWLGLMRRLPQVFSHFDFQRRNLILRKSAEGRDELVLIDWAMVGIGPLGGELNSLIGADALLFEIDPRDMASLDQIVFDAYLAGLREGGWSGDPDLIRLAYTAYIALFCGAIGPAAIALLDTEDWQQWGWRSFACGPEDLTEGWGYMCRYALDRADEARRLAERLRV